MNATTAIDTLSIAYSLAVFGIEIEIDLTEGTEPTAAIATVTAPAPVQLASMNIRQLRDAARGKIPGFMQMKKAALLAALEALEAPAVTPKGKSRRGGRKARQCA